MAEREVVVKVRLEDRSAVERLGRLESETKAYQRELRLLNAEIAANGKATREQAIRVGELTSRIRANQGVTRELKNDLSGLTAAGLRFRDKMAGATTEALAGFGVTAVTVTGAIIALRQAIVSSIEAFQEQQKVEAQLRFVAGEASDALIAQAAALQQVSTVGDEVIIGQQAFLASLGFTEDKIRDIIPAALDLAAATGKDLEFAVRNLAKTYSGLTGELGELIPELKNYSKEELQAGAATEYAATQFAGQAEALAKTDIGKIQQMRNALGDLGETVGKLVSPAIAALADGLNTLLTGGNAAKIATDFAKFEEAVNKRAEAIYGSVERIRSASDFDARYVEEQLKKQNNKLLAATQAYLTGDKQLVEEYLFTTRERLKELSDRGYGNLNNMAKITFASLRELEAQLAAMVGSNDKAASSTEKHAETLAILEDRLKEAQDARKNIDITDKAALATNAELIKSLKDQIAAIEGDTAASSKNAKAIDERTAALMRLREEMERIAGVPITQQAGLGAGQIAAGQTPQGAIDPFLQAMGVADVSNLMGPGATIATDLQDNLDRTDELTAQYANLFLDLSTSIGQSLGTMFQDVEDTNQKVIMSILETVKTGIRLWLSLTLAREVGTKSFAGIATAAVLTTLVEATFAAAQSAIQGFNTGGVIKGGTPIRRANGDNVLITARVGEVILNEEQQRRLFAMLGPGAFNALGVPGFATGGTITRGTALVNQAAPRPEVIASAENAAFYRTFELRPEVAVKEIIKVSNRVKVIEANNSL